MRSAKRSIFDDVALATRGTVPQGATCPSGIQNDSAGGRRAREPAKARTLTRLAEFAALAGDPDFVVVSDRRRVDAWSVRRLPFEPRGTMLEFRSALRSALSSLVAHHGTLRCVYASPSVEFCDAENVLLYNIGMSSFGRLTERGVSFERCFDVPSPPRELSGPALHHHSYTPAPGLAFGHWQIDREIVVWRGGPPARLNRAAHWWWATSAPRAMDTGLYEFGGPLALELRVQGSSGSLISFLKPMLDGIIAAFHRDAAPDDVVVARLARDLDQSEAAIRSRLTEGDAPLGIRRLVRPFRDAVQWNPADDLCVACSVELRDVPGEALVQGRLVSVSPRNALPAMPDKAD